MTLTAPQPQSVGRATRALRERLADRLSSLTRAMTADGAAGRLKPTRCAVEEHLVEVGAEQQSHEGV
jgi:hypothetical protein